jgi:hypothetical protein
VAKACVLQGIEKKRKKEEEVERLTLYLTLFL